MTKTFKKSVSILLAIIMIFSVFTIVPVAAGASTWTFKLHSNFTDANWSDMDLVSGQSYTLDLAAGNYQFLVLAYEDGNLRSWRGNEQAGSSTDTYSQIMYDNGGNAKFAATGGKYVLNYDGGSGVLSINKVVVATINTATYSTLEDAFAAAVDGDTITLTANSTGNGIKAPQGKFQPNGLTVDFAGYTYTVDGTLVGSTGTETQAFQLLKDNTITFKNGTITSENAKMLIQNYSNLTLDNMTLTLDNPNYAYAYTLSNNNGDIVIDDTTINANPAGGFAFDVCRYASYPSVNVTVTGDSVINGDVEISASGSDAKDGFSLTLESGTLNGDIDVTATAAAAMAATPAKAEVTKDADFAQDAPADYRWVSNGDGTSSLVAIPYVAQIEGGDKYETLEAAVAAAVDGDTITLLASSAGNGIKAPEGKFNTNGLTIDFAGFTYTVDGDLVGSTGTQTQAFQLLKDNTITLKNGTIYSEKAKMLVQNYSNLTLDNMTLDGSHLVGSGRYTLSNNNGNVVIDDTTIIAKEGNNFAFDVCRYASYPSVNVTVTGDSVINGDVEISASGSDAKDGFSLTLTSGTMTGDIVVDATAEAAIAATPAKAEVTKAAAFEQDAPADYEWVDNGDGTSSLAAIEYAAQIGNTKYRTLEAAFAAAEDGDTITLLASSAGNGIKVPEGKFNTDGLTVDFNGFTYTVNGTTVGSTNTETQGFQLLKDNKITFENGAITGSSVDTPSLVFLVQNYSDLTLDNMELSLTGTYYNQYTLSNNNGAIVINDSTINAPDYTWIDPSISASDAGSFAFDVCRYASYPSVSVTVTGDSVINGDVEVSASANDAKDGLALNLVGGTMNGDIVLDASAEAAMAAENTTASVNKATTFTQEAPADYEWVDDGNGGQTLAPIPYVAQIGNNKYLTLEDAFAAAVDGDTITVLADSTGNGIKAPQGKFATGLTVDFDGHTYTVDGTLVGSTGTETQAFQLLKDNTITFKNGTITSENAKMLIQNYSNLTLDNMTLTLDNPNYAYAYTLSNNNGDIVIDDTTINANPAGGFAFDVCRYASYPSVNVTVTGDSEINGDVEVYASGSNPRDGFSLTLESGTMTGDIVVDATAEAAMAATPAKAEVTKADTFTQEAPEDFEWVDNGDGTSTLAPIPYVAQNSTTGVKYLTLEAAVAAAVDGDTITLLASSAGNGIKAPEGKFNTNGLTIDFAGFTYTVDGDLVGSTGTQTQAFQLLKDNNITLKNGTITSEKAKMLVQNYSNLTLEGMTLDGSDLVGSGRYTLSNNNGNVVIDGSTIIAKEGNNFAFDVCRYASYPSVNVTVTGNSVIDGDVEISASGSDAKDGFSLTLQSGSMDGDIILAGSAATAIANTPAKATVTKATTFTQDAPEGYMWVAAGEGTQTIAKAVAEIDGTPYASLEAAFAAAQDGDTITVLADSTGNGIKAPQGKFATGLTVDFNGHTYTVDGTLVGSTGTETQAFQLLKDNTITFKDGTITSENAKMLIQNYSNLTLDNMTLTLDNPNYAYAYTLSNNNGNIVIDDTTINANPAGGFAFDVCRYASYPSVNVTVTGDSVINGDVEVYASGSDPKNGFSLTLESGTMTGDIVLDATAENVINATPEKGSVKKAETFEQEAPLGYEWVDTEVAGVQTLGLSDFALKHSISLDGDIALNFYLNPQIVKAGDTITFTWTVNGVEKTDSYTLASADLKPEGYKAKVNVPAAEMNYDITATYGNNTDTYSVRDYCDVILSDEYEAAYTGDYAKLENLVLNMLDYGAKAQTAFNRTDVDLANKGVEINGRDYTDVEDWMINEALEAANNGAIGDDPAIVEHILGVKYYTTSLMFLTESTLRHIFTTPTYPGTWNYNYDGQQYDYYYWVEKTNIAAAELDTLWTFNVGSVEFRYSALNYCKAVLNSEMDAKYKELAASTYWYNQAANAFFPNA